MGDANTSESPGRPLLLVPLLPTALILEKNSPSKGCKLVQTLGLNKKLHTQTTHTWARVSKGEHRGKILEPLIMLPPSFFSRLPKFTISYSN